MAHPTLQSAHSDGIRNSFLYEGTILHHRFSPVDYAFKHGIFLFCLDLDELDEIQRTNRLFAVDRPSIYSLQTKDHIDLGFDSIKENILAYLASTGNPAPPGAIIQLVTHPRFLGYVFNPVSFYFLYDRDQSYWGAVAEVGNTFGEKKPYFIPASPTSNNQSNRFETEKNFYVSPFSALDNHFSFRLSPPTKTLNLGINTIENGRPILVSRLDCERKRLSSRQLVKSSLSYPFMTMRIIGLIHWHALRLWMKKIPWYKKSHRPELQTHVFSPRTHH